LKIFNSLISEMRMLRPTKFNWLTNWHIVFNGCVVM
jgi:hypothetical protein